MTVQETLRSRLIDEGVRILETEGLSGLTIRAAARAVGVSHGAPRRHFPTLVALQGAVARRGLDDMSTRVRLAVERHGEPEQRLRSAALEYVQFAADRPEMFALMFRHDILENSGADLRSTSLPLFGFVSALVEPFSAGDSRSMSLRLWTSIHGIAALNSTAALRLVDELDATALVEATVASMVGTAQPTSDLTDAGS